MSKHTDYIQLVRQAQQGHTESRAGLLRLVEPRLTQYVGRLTLDHDLTAEIVQDSIAEMLLSEVEQEWLQTREQDVLAELVTQELKQIVVRAVAELEPRQQAVLTMRGVVIFDGTESSDCLYWNCVGYLPEQERPFVGPQTDDGRRKGSTLPIGDYFGFNHWRSPEAFGSCERLPHAQVAAVIRRNGKDPYDRPVGPMGPIHSVSRSPARRRYLGAAHFTALIMILRTFAS
ncbi:MAG TPA: hypothetical protein PKH24_19175 [Sedimentisphaerales bacterium]|jgi:hypothetical protein|nr:hypothetical protein [Sedimentisphaerales bacterium]HNU30411.1 hypothetical protein [Sedimentisphaerales bacterium]